VKKNSAKTCFIPKSNIFTYDWSTSSNPSKLLFNQSFKHLLATH